MVIATLMGLLIHGCVINWLIRFPVKRLNANWAAGARNRPVSSPASEIQKGTINLRAGWKGPVPSPKVLAELGHSQKQNGPLKQYGTWVGVEV